jgi:hypothetical protein
MKTNKFEMRLGGCIGENIALFWTGKMDIMPAEARGRE